MDGFKAYHEMENVSELISDMLRTEPPYISREIGLDAKTNEVGTLSQREVSREEYLETCLEIVITNMTSIQESLVEEKAHRIVRDILSNLSDRAFQFKDEYGKKHILTMQNIQEYLSNYFPEGDTAKILYHDYCLGEEFYETMSKLGMDIVEDDKKYNDLAFEGIDKLASILGVLKEIDKMIHLYDSIAELDAFMPMDFDSKSKNAVDFKVIKGGADDGE